jgi:hypothetical protein
MPETGASGSVGAPLEQSAGATRQQPAPRRCATGPLYLFRFALEQTSLRASKGDCVLRLPAVRSFLRAQLSNAKPLRF